MGRIRFENKTTRMSFREELGIPECHRKHPFILRKEKTNGITVEEPRPKYHRNKDLTLKKKTLNNRRLIKINKHQYNSKNKNKINFQ